jgi:predicted transcriptional regulator of viral defense system
MRDKSRTAEEIIGRIATAAHGVVTRAEVLRAGVTRAEISRRLQTGALLREHRGVYRVGHRAPSVEARYVAAVRACGDGALISGRAAAHLLHLIKGAAPPAEVTTPTERHVHGVATRRSASICRADATSWRGVPVTTVPRTLVDLAAVLTSADLARACHEAGVLHRTTPAQVREILERQPNASGAAKLRSVLEGDEPVTLSRLERAFLKLLAAARLPLPETNQRASGRRVDCRWPDQRLTVELDSYRYHSSRHAWERDRRREREARARGDEFRRYTYGDVFETPALMLSELRMLLLAGRPA